MHKVVQRLKLSVVGAALAATAVAVGGIAVVSSAVAANQLTATAEVNVRSGPGLGYSILAVVPRGGMVTATGTQSGSWLEVTYNGTTGYVYSAYWVAVPDAAQTTAPSGPQYRYTTTALNVRSGPGTTYPVIALTTLGQSMSTTGVTSGVWVEVNWEGGKAWVSSYYLSATAPAPAAPPADGELPAPSPVTTVGQVIVTDDMNLRTEGYFGAPVVGILPADSIVDITGQTTATYTQISYQGRLLWVASSYTKPITVAPALSLVTDTRSQVLVDFVKAQIGKPYVWGAEGPDSFDCSGLTWAAYQKIGMTIPRTSNTQVSVGQPVSKADLKPGDLIFWYSPVSHVSMYVGDGMMVHARNPSSGIVYQSVDSYIQMGAPYTGARRYLS